MQLSDRRVFSSDIFRRGTIVLFSIVSEILVEHFYHLLQRSPFFILVLQHLLLTSSSITVKSKVYYAFIIIYYSTDDDTLCAKTQSHPLLLSTNNIGSFSNENSDFTLTVSSYVARATIGEVQSYLQQCNKGCARLLYLDLVLRYVKVIYLN